MMTTPETAVPNRQDLSQQKQVLYSQYASGDLSLRDATARIAAIEPKDTSSRRMRLVVAIVSAFGAILLPNWYNQRRQ